MTVQPAQPAAPSAPAGPPALALTARERELVLLLRSIDFWRASRERSAIVDWSGVRLRVFDAQQIR